MKLIETTIKNEMIKTSQAVEEFPWNNIDKYSLWLAQTYYMVCHSTRLVALAGALVELTDQTMHLRFLEHAREEKGHEKLCLNDLKNLEQSLSELPELETTKSLYRNQYYLIEKKSPLALFGYILFLECLSINAGKVIYSNTKKIFGEKASSFLRVHSQEDESHVETAMLMLKELPARELTYIIENLTTTGELYRLMLYQIKKQSKSSLAA